ncbi:MAG: Vitamin B12 transporter BtuB [bacterium]|nr:Vitamin B12 transporter BtuB [bacterium]
MFQRFCQSSFFAFLIFTALHAFAANTTAIQGRVTDSRTGAGIAGANVLIQGTWRGAATDANGYFTINNVPASDRIVLVVKHIGYTEISLTIKPGTENTQNIAIPLRQATLRLADEVIVLAEHSNDAYLQNAQRSNPDGGGRILRDIPGLQAVTRGYVAFDPVIRGMKEEQIVVTIDGIKVEPACNGRMDPATAYADLAELDALIVNKGPYEVTGTASAIGGSINMVKLRPVYQPAGVKLTGVVGGSYNSVATGDKEQLRLGMSTARVGLQLGLSRQAGDNYESARSEVPFSGYQDSHVDAVFGVRLAENQELRLAHYRSDGEDTGYPALPMDTRDHQARLYGIDYIVSAAPLAISRFHLKAYHSAISHLMDNWDRPAAAMREMAVLGETETTGGNVLAEWQFQRNSLKAGFDVWRLLATARQDMLNKQTGMRTSMLTWPEVTMRSGAVFTEYGRSFSDAWLLTAGARASRVESAAEALTPAFLNFQQRTSGAATESNWEAYAHLNFVPQTTWAFSAACGRGVRPASHKERYGWYSLNRLDNYDYLGSPQLRPEANVAVNLTARYHADKLQLRVEPYYNRLQNYIAGEVRKDLLPQSMGARGVKVYTNIGNARIYGVEADLNWQLSKNFGCFSNVSFTAGRDLERNAPLPEIPPLSTLTGLRYVYPANRFWVQIETRAAARQNQVSPFAGEDKTAGFTVYNIRSGIRLGNQFAVQTGVENLTNVFYHEHLDRDNIPQPGRNFYLKTTMHF